MPVCVKLSNGLPAGAQQIAAIATEHINTGTSFIGIQSSTASSAFQTVTLLGQDDARFFRCALVYCRALHMAESFALMLERHT